MSRRRSSAGMTMHGSTAMASLSSFSLDHCQPAASRRRYKLGTIL